MELTDLEKLEVVRAFRDAKTKTDALPERLKDEFQQADVENREPIPITPLTEIKASVVMKAIEAIDPTKVDAALADVIGAQRKGCRKLGDARVALHSDQLLALLTAAGVNGA